MQISSERTRVVEFLKRHVIGTVVTAEPVVSKIDGEKITSIYEEDAVYSNWAESSEGFAFHMTTLARGTRYLTGKGLKAEGTLNAVRVMRYEITERLSTKALVGFSRFVSSTNMQPDPFAGVIFLVRMKMTKEALHVEESQVGYSDRIGADGSPRPFAVDGLYIYSLKDETLEVNYRQTTFDVDPVAMQRTKTKEEFPIQISRQIHFPQPLETIP